MNYRDQDREYNKGKNRDEHRAWQGGPGRMDARDQPASPVKVEYGKAFLSSAAAGTVFGIVAVLIFLHYNSTPWPTVPFVVGVSLGVGLISGLAGLTGAYLDVFLSAWGVKNAKLRAVASYGIVALFTFTIVFLGVTVFGNIAIEQEIQRYVLWGSLAGMVFGALVALISFRNESIRQKMRMLEMENRHLGELASREELLREAARNLAVAEERNRMARELHDSIAQGMHGIVYSLRSLRGILENDRRGMEILEHLEETAQDTLKELRHLVMELCPSPLEGNGLSEALRLYSDLFTRRQQIELDLRLNYSGGLQPEQEMAIYRLVQEALTNIQKHARANRVDLWLQENNGTVVLTVRDNGRGFDPSAESTGYGLGNMVARARQNGGTLEIVSAPGKGTTVTARFPKEQ